MSAEPEETWWLVTGEVTVSAYTYVRASSAEDARRIAASRDGQLAPYGADRSGADPTQSAVIEEGDGSLRVTGCRPANADERKEIRHFVEDEGDDGDMDTDEC